MERDLDGGREGVRKKARKGADKSVRTTMMYRSINRKDGATRWQGSASSLLGLAIRSWARETKIDVATR